MHNLNNDERFVHQTRALAANERIPVPGTLPTLDAIVALWSRDRHEPTGTQPADMTMQSGHRVIRHLWVPADADA